VCRVTRVPVTPRVSVVSRPLTLSYRTKVTDFASQQGVLEVQKLGGIPPRIPPRIPPSHAWAEFDFSKVLFANSAQVKFWSGSQEFFPNFPPDRK